MCVSVFTKRSGSAVAQQQQDKCNKHDKNRRTEAKKKKKKEVQYINRAWFRAYVCIRICRQDFSLGDCSKNACKHTYSSRKIRTRARWTTKINDKEEASKTKKKSCTFLKRRNSRKSKKKKEEICCVHPQNKFKKRAIR